jgi:tyrosine-specific transport protein
MFRNKLVGGVMMVAGTSIGAGMLAMPITAAKIGFAMSIAVLCLIGIVMGISAYLMSKIYEATNSDSTVSKLAGDILGRTWQLLAGGAILMLLYSLIVAYLSGLSGTLSSLSGINYSSVVILLSLILFVSLAISDKLFDIYNRVALLIKGFFLVLIVWVLYPHISYGNLLSSNEFNSDYNPLVVLPIFVTSFGFHGGIPFIFKFFERDKMAFNKAVFLGVLTTLSVYVVWLIFSFGVLHQQTIISSDLSGFIDALNKSVQSETFNKSVSVFTVLAILTSLFGVAAGLFDFIHESLNDNNRFKSRVMVSGLVFFIPMVVSITGKGLFIKALGFAGVALTIIAIFIPCMICFKKRLSHPVILWFCMILGIATVAGELMKNLQ